MISRLFKLASWKDNLQKTRYVMDALLLISFMLISAPQATGVPIHEWGSVIFIIPFVIHLLLHWDWIKQSIKRLFQSNSIKERFNLIWNYLFYLMMVIAFVSGILVSVALLPALNIDLNIQDFWSKIHHDSATIIMPMLGVHLALHWDWIIKLTKRILMKKEMR